MNLRMIVPNNRAVVLAAVRLLAAVLLLAAASLALAQQRKNPRSGPVYGPPAPAQRYPSGYSSELNGQVEIYESEKRRKALEHRRRVDYFRRFIDHDFSITNRGVSGY
jgi:hypothetical protein